MKPIYSFLLSAFLLCTIHVNAQITISGAAPAIFDGTTYTTFTGTGGAFAALNGVAAWAGKTIVLTVTDNITTEDGNNSLNQPATSTWTSLTIRPSVASQRTIRGNVTNGMIRFNGADNVTIDGRFGGTGKYLRFLNSNTSNPTFTFLNDATNNTITYSTIESGTSIAQVGAIFFSSSTGTLGNSNNTISYCDIREKTIGVTVYPLCLIVSNGSTTAQNSSNIIDHCNLFNCYQNGNPGISVYLQSGTTAWTISNNSFYQTGTRTTTIDSRLISIYVNNSAGNGFQITGNFIGGTAPLCGDTAMTLTTTTTNSTGVANEINGIFMYATGTATPSTIQNNTIKNISLTSTARELLIFSNPEFSFIGICAFDGSYIIDGNTIGAETGIGSISVAFNPDYNFFYTSLTSFVDGMQLAPTGTLTVTNNKVGAISITGNNNSAQILYFRGALLVGNPSAPVTFSGNLFGSGLTANSIQQQNTGTKIANFLGLITATTNTAILNILNNTVRNFNNMSASNNYMIAFNFNGTCQLNASGNIIQDLSSSSTSTNTTPGTNVMSGMVINNTGTGHIISGNTVSGLKSVGGNASTAVYGISLDAVGATGTISKNKISNLTNTSTDVTSKIFGINNFNSTNFSFSNNQVSITNSPNTNALDIEGIHEQTGTTAKYYFNSVYIGGSAASNSRNSYAFNRTATTSVEVKDNIFYNARTGGTGYHVGIGNTINSATGWPTTASDYNDLYSTNSSTLGQWLGSTLANNRTYATWQSSTGGDANSINVTPVFSSATDLHLTSAAGNLALKTGTVIAGITDDIDGDLRNPIIPTMGADEFQVPNMWTGNVSTNWGTNNNWDDANIPATSANITIPFGVPNMPVLDADRSIGTLSFIRTGTGTVGLNNHKLTIGGAISGTGTFTGTAAGGVSNSELELNGAAGMVNFTQTDATTRSLNNLTLGTSGTATIGNALDIYGNINVKNTAPNALNFNGQEITLKSNVNNTATIDELNTTGSNLTGATNVTMERWLPLRNSGGTGSGTGNNGRAYRLLTPTVSSASATINDSWQEGLTNTTIGVYNIPPAPYQNFGTHITGTGGSANGFDITQTNESSLYSFTNGSNINATLGYPAVNNTNILIDGKKAYFIYIRGDRNVSTQLAYQPGGGMPTSSTTLRAKGSVLKGSIAQTISATAGDFSLITNPYPAPLDWDAVSAGNSNITSSYTFWNPSNGIRGGFTTVPTGSGTHRYIQPGEGFFVQKNGTGGGTVTITEAMKAVGNNDNTVFFTEHTPFESFRVGLFLTENNNVRHTADEVLVRYDNNYAAGVDYDDAEEIKNWNENIAISQSGTRLAIESRPVITNKDTIQLYISGLRKTVYEFEFTPSLFSNTSLIAELVDNYLHTRTLLSVTDNITVPFTVNNDAASFANGRFMIVFSKPAGPLPIDMSSIKAYEKGSGIQVDWVMNSEQDMDRYEVEKSTDGRHFTQVGTVASKGNSSIQVNYGWYDASPVTGDNFYRIKSFEKSGANKYSSIVRVNISKGGSIDISIYPNPFEGNGFNLQMSKLAAGTYNLTMYNNLGQKVYSGTVQHGGGSGTQYINLGKDLAAGTYTVKITDGNMELIRIVTKK